MLLGSQAIFTTGVGVLKSLKVIVQDVLTILLFENFAVSQHRRASVFVGKIAGHRVSTLTIFLSFVGDKLLKLADWLLRKVIAVILWGTFGDFFILRYASVDLILMSLGILNGGAAAEAVFLLALLSAIGHLIAPVNHGRAHVLPDVLARIVILVLDLADNLVVTDLIFGHAHLHFFIGVSDVRERAAKRLSASALRVLAVGAVFLELGRREIQRGARDQCRENELQT